MKNLKLKNKVIVIAEIGLSHEGSLGIAKSYIDLAKQVGADYVKFQTHIAEEESSKFEKFRVNIFPQDKSRYEYWNRTSFSSDEWLFLKKYCDKKNIGFISSPFSVNIQVHASAPSGNQQHSCRKLWLLTLSSSA